VGQTNRVIDRAAETLTEALLSGDDEQCRQIALDLYLAEHSIAAICDRLLAKAFESIGERCQCGDAEVYQERRACSIALRLLHELRGLLPAPPLDAPLAIGGAVEGDQYDLGTAMAELVLRDAQWNAVSLGNNLPFKTLAEAIKHHRPRLFWISCSHIRDEEEFLRGYSELYKQFGFEVAFVVGGRSLIDSVRRRMKYAAYCGNMRRFETLTRTLRPAPERVGQ
jgi:methanogenic corrinoid protein MtbC1